MAVIDLVKETSVHQALDTLRKGGLKSRYENFIGGRWVAPLKGRYFTDYSPINGEPICEIAVPRPKMSKELSTRHTR